VRGTLQVCFDKDEQHMEVGVLDRSAGRVRVCGKGGPSCGDMASTCIHAPTLAPVIEPCSYFSSHPCFNCSYQLQDPRVCCGLAAGRAVFSELTNAAGVLPLSGSAVPAIYGGDIQR
jgi:hypothetical protein